MKRSTGAYVTTSIGGESVQAFVSEALPPANPALAMEGFADLNRAAELALA